MVTKETADAFPIPFSRAVLPACKRSIRVFCRFCFNTSGSLARFILLMSTLPEIPQSAAGAILPPPNAANARPRVAVVPAAGFGTRLRPLTDSIAKEMLPVGRRLALEIILEELAGAGMERICLVLSPAKEPVIRKRFGTQSGSLSIDYALQAEMRGLGHAILQAAPFVGAGGPFVVALGDAVFEEAESGAITRRLCEAVAQNNAHIGLVVQQVPRERLSRYGIVKPTCTAGTNPFAISGIVEKPPPDDASSNYAAAARYVARPDIFDVLEKTPPSQNGEIQFTDAMQTVLQNGGTGIAVPLQSGETRHDIGGLDSYFKAFAAFALQDPDYGAGLREYLQTRLQAADTLSADKVSEETGN